MNLCLSFPLKKAIKFFENTRWPEDIVCLYCQSKRIYKVKNRLAFISVKVAEKLLHIKQERHLSGLSLS